MLQVAPFTVLRFKPSLRAGALVCTFMWAAIAWCPVTVAQTLEVVKPEIKQPPTAASSSPAPAKSGPRWNELTAQQRQILRPLNGTWNSLGGNRKDKWLALAANYPQLSSEEQAKLTSRMAEWAALKPQEREQARLNYADTKKIPPSKRAATWEAYQALSPEDRQKLANQAASKPNGAAIAIKPAAPNRFTWVPITRKTPSDARPVLTPLDPNTLLPQVPRTTTDSSASPQAQSN